MTTVTTDTDAPPAAFEPVALPEGRIACASCGAAVSQLRAAVERQVFTAWYTPTVGPRAMISPAAAASQPFELTRCAACRPMRDRAAAYVPSGGIMQERAEAAMCALSVLGKPLPHGPVNLAALIDRLAVPGRLARWQQQARPGLCSPAPWAHVTEEDRAEIRRALAGMLAERMAAGRPPLRVAPPEVEGGLRGCLMCGVGHIEVPAVRVARMGGEKAAAGLWHRSSMALPSPQGLQRHEGHVCPACRAAQDSAGSNGPSARGRALLDYLISAGRQDEAGKLRQALTADETVMAVLPAWCATGRRTRPSETPWKHLGTLKFDA
ncbi:MAG: hypothetical protein JWM19_1408 [Actinomycetia bacterium]|nr:hypothetical protein [Actinomycetes bacterium]